MAKVNDMKKREFREYELREKAFDAYCNSDYVFTKIPMVSFSWQIMRIQNRLCAEMVR